jgi:hypothetical protein
METDNEVLIESARAALQSWLDHRAWLVDQIEHESISDYDRVRFNIAIRRASEQIRVVQNKISEIEKAATEPVKPSRFVRFGAGYPDGSQRKFSRQTRVF